MQTEHHTQELIEQPVNVEPVNVELADAAESNEDLDAALATARTEFERAEADAVAAEQRAVDAAELFTTQPSADTHTASAVAAQLAVNARQLTRDRGERLARLDAEHMRRGKLARLRELEPAADGERFLSDAFDEVQSLVAALQTHMVTVSRRLVAGLDAQAVAAAESSRLRSALGMSGPAPRPVDLNDLNERLQVGLAKAFPQTKLRSPHENLRADVRALLEARMSVPPRISGYLQRVDGQVVATLSVAEVLSESQAQ